MITRDKITGIIDGLERFILSEHYAGYDPYDLLSSHLFSFPVLKSNKLIRFGAQQVFRRIPYNMRPALRIKKEINPVTLGLCIQSYSYLSTLNTDKKKYYLKEIDLCLSKLIDLKSPGFSGYCWGYSFNWEARYFRVPKFMPTLVATGIITNGLYEYYKIYKDERIREILVSSADFVLNDLQQSYENETICFSYSPNDNQKVYNATMKGARLLTQVYIITNDEKYCTVAEKTVKFVINNQSEDGSWYYSKDDARKWVDNFHTAYVLDALDEFVNLTKKYEYKDNLNRGIKYYLQNLFTEEGFPKYYNNSFYPIDSTEVAQSIITLTRFGFLENAKVVMDFALNNLYSNKGYFYYQKKVITDKTPFIRWSIGWFLLAFSKYLYRKEIETK